MINLDFCDMAKGFDKNKNIFTEIIGRRLGEQCRISSTPDFLIYSCYGNEHYNYKNCVKIFYTGEAVTPDFNECDYAIGFDPITFRGRYCKRPIWLYNTMPKDVITDEQALNRKFCNFIYSNDTHGPAVEFRKTFAKKLMEYKQVDCPGKVLNNMENAIEPRNGNWKEGKLDFIKNYKFTIAFENCSFDGYTTEKMVDPLSVHSVPIYWGNPFVEDDFNKDAFINCNGYEERMDKVIERIIELDCSDEKYLQMVHAKPMNDSYNLNEINDFEEFLVEIIQNARTPLDKDPMEFGARMMRKSGYWERIKRNIIERI